MDPIGLESEIESNGVLKVADPFIGDSISVKNK